MPVQIPTVQRIAPQDRVSIGRIDATPIRTDQGQTAIAEGIAKLAETGLKLYDKYDDQSATLAAKAVGIEYHQFLESKLEGDPSNGVLGIKHMKGDPTTAYQQFDTESIKKQNELQAKHSESSLKVRTKVQQQLQEISANFYDRKTIAYGNQLNSYGLNVIEANGNILQQTSFDKLAGVKKDDPKTLKPFIESLKAITSNVYEGAAFTGLAEKTKDGNFINVHASAEFKAFTERSKAIVDGIEILTNSGKLGEAQLMMKEFKGAIDIKDLDKVEKKLHTAAIEDQALQFISKNRNLEPKEFFKATDKIKDLEVRDKAQTMLSAREHQMAFMQRQQEDLSYDKLMSYTMKRQDGTLKNIPPFESYDDAIMDKNVKRYIDNVSPEQRTKFKKYLTSPKESDPVKLNELNDLYASDQLASVPPNVIDGLLVDLNAYHRKQYKNLWLGSQRAEESEVIRRTKQAYMKAEQLAESGQFDLIRRKKFGVARRPEDAEFLNSIQEELTSMGATLPTDPAKLDVFVKNFIIRKKNAEPKGFFSWGKKEIIPELPLPVPTYKQFLDRQLPSKPKNLGGVVVTPVDKSKIKALQPNATDDEKSAYYKSVKGSYPNTRSQLNDFIKAENSK